jgi:hypothetical protein
MCVVSAIGDHYGHKWKPFVQPVAPATEPWPVTRQEFEWLKRELEIVKEMLKLAKKYDLEHDEPDCHTEDKVEILKKMAELLGVDLEGVLDDLQK